MPDQGLRPRAAAAADHVDGERSKPPQDQGGRWRRRHGRTTSLSSDWVQPCCPALTAVDRRIKFVTPAARTLRSFPNRFRVRLYRSADFAGLFGGCREDGVFAESGGWE